MIREENKRDACRVDGSIDHTTPWCQVSGSDDRRVRSSASRMVRKRFMFRFRLPANGSGIETLRVC